MQLVIQLTFGDWKNSWTFPRIAAPPAWNDRRTASQLLERKRLAPQVLRRTRPARALAVREWSFFWPLLGSLFLWPWRQAARWNKGLPRRHGAHPFLRAIGGRIVNERH